MPVHKTWKRTISGLANARQHTTQIQNSNNKKGRERERERERDEEDGDRRAGKTETERERGLVIGGQAEEFKAQDDKDILRNPS